VKPERFVPWVQGFGAQTVIVDSLNKVAMDLSRDEPGSRVSAALNDAVAAGVEVFVNHHQRKAQSDNRRPKTLDDVYGSGWITAGSGSALLLWGKPGDPIVELVHLKQPAEPVGPFQILIDLAAGAMEVMAGSDLVAMLREARNGFAAKDAARVLFGTRDPDPAEVQKARRKLDGLVKQGLARPG
jgi:hypothetical protein